MWIVRKMHDILMNLKTKNALISHLIGDTLLVLGWISFAFRTALMLCGIDSKCWKGSSKILIHIDIIASQSCCPTLLRLSGALLDWDLAAVEAI